MKVIVHYPCGDQAETLHTKVAQAHAQIVLTYLKKLPCLVEQKQQLLSRICEEKV